MLGIALESPNVSISAPPVSAGSPWSAAAWRKGNAETEEEETGVCERLFVRAVPIDCRCLAARNRTEVVSPQSDVLSKKSVASHWDFLGVNLSAVWFSCSRRASRRA